MRRSLALLLPLTLLGAPALAKPKKVPADQIAPAPTATASAAPAPRPRVKADEAPDSEPSPPADETAAEDTAGWSHRKTHLGASLILGTALSSKNKSGSITPLFPFISLGFVIDLGLGGPLYLRLEPSVGYLRRTSEVDTIRQIDARQDELIITKQKIVNRVNAIDFTLRPMLGYDYTPHLTGRLGLLLGLSTAGTGAESCSSAPRTSSFLYGGHLTPVAYRIDQGSRAIEVGLSVEVRSQKIPQCGVDLNGSYSVPKGYVATFTPKISADPLTVVAVGAQAAVLF